MIVVGCGRMGAELALALAREGKEVTVVDRDRRAFARLGAGFAGATVEGVGFDRDVLLRAGVERSDALAALTSGDNANIVTARIARTIFRVPKVVARVYDPRRAEIYTRLGLQTVSTTAWGVSRMQQLLVHGELNVIRSSARGRSRSSSTRCRATGSAATWATSACPARSASRPSCAGTRRCCPRARRSSSRATWR